MALELENPIAAESEANLHVAVFPWLAFGHMLPFLELSKSLAQKGHKVSFISTSRNIDRLPKIPQELDSSITFVKLTLPHVDGLPPNAEATMEIHTDDIPLLRTAYDGLEPELTRFLEASVPDLLIYDFAPHWLPSVAAKLGIYRAFFCAFNAWFLGFLGTTDAMMNISFPRTKLEDFLVPPEWVPFQTKAAYKTYEVLRIANSVKDTNSGLSAVFRMGKAIVGSNSIIIRHCNEFEGAWLKLLEDLYHKPVLPVGLMPPPEPSSEDDNETWASVKTWLDNQSKGSVVYVALGSECPLSQAELSDLALGLDSSGLPFMWAVRNPAGPELVQLPEGFEEKVKDRGLVWKGWVPQVKILSHDSVGGFLTHCGWNSISEGLTFGRPLIMLPYLVDQGLNARVLEDNQLGIEIPRNEWDGSYTSKAVAESVRLVMVENDGKKFRDKAKGISAIFGNKKLQDSYIQKAIEFLESHSRVSEPLIE